LNLKNSGVGDLEIPPLAAVSNDYVMLKQCDRIIVV